MNKDAIIQDIGRRYELTHAGLDVSFLVNELQWMRDMLRREWPQTGQRPGWVNLVLDDKEVTHE